MLGRYLSKQYQDMDYCNDLRGAASDGLWLSYFQYESLRSSTISIRGFCISYSVAREIPLPAVSIRLEEPEKPRVQSIVPS